MDHSFYMQMCLDLATKSLGKTKTNPLVGAVIVHNNKIIGRGRHEFYGGPHAEVNAIHSVEDLHLLEQATIFVNLEPCAHYGKTPPCVDLILKHKIPRVVIGAQDPFSEVNGKGIELLRMKGVAVESGVLVDQCRFLNRRFYTFHEKKRPYIILKWAQTKDGFMDIPREMGEKGTFWITQPETKKLTHQWRSEEMGILVGRKTIETDNPELTNRMAEGENPIRIVLDPEARLHPQYSVFNNQSQTIHLTTKELPDYTISNILEYLFKEGINSVIIEGGKITLQKFIDANLWDEARVLVGNAKLENGLRAPILDKEPLVRKLEIDSVLTYFHF